MVMARTLLLLFPLALPPVSCASPPLETARIAPKPAVRPEGLHDPAPARILASIAVIIAAALLASCALFRPVGSWVEIAVEGDAAPISEAIVIFVAQSVPEAGATIVLAPPPADQQDNLVSRQVREELSGRGYTLAGAGSTGHQVSYLVSKYGEQVLLRMTLDRTEASVLFARDATGALRASAPLAMRQKNGAM